MTIKLLETNGDFIGNLDNPISCFVQEERNGLFEVVLEYPNQYHLSDKLIEGKMIQCDANDTLLNQKFRIYKTRKVMKNTIEVSARHISFDLVDDFVENISMVNQSCEYALNEIFRNSNFSKNYRGFSDIVNAQDFKVEMSNCLESIVGKRGSIIDTFGTGAEILRDNTDIHVLNRRGRDNGVHISYAKNMTDITIDEDRSELITRIYAFAKGKDADGKEIIINATGKYIDSPRISLYEHPFIKSIDFTDKFEENVQPTPDKIKSFAERYFRDNNVDIPKTSYKISFIPLSKTTEGGPNDNISLCDTVYVDDTRYNIQTQAKAIKVNFNVLKNRYESIELGQPRSTLGNLVGEEGTQGPQGPPGPPGKDGDIGDFPDTLPGKSTLNLTQLGMSSIQCDWTFENQVYYTYQLFASKIRNFQPTMFDLIHEGQASSYLFVGQPKETWYFRVRGGNSHGRWGEFSEQASITLDLADKMDNYFTSAAIGQAVVGSLTADYMTAGVIKGQWIDAKNLSVTDGNGKRTLDVDSFGNVYLDVTTLKINSGDVSDSLTKLNLDMNGVQTEVKNKLNTSEFGTKLQQSSTDIQIGFNGINNRVSIDSREMTFRDINGRRTYAIVRGQANLYNPQDATLLGSMVPRSTIGGSYLSNGISTVISNNGFFYSIAKASDWNGDGDVTYKPIEYFVLNFKDVDDTNLGKAGAHFHTTLFPEDGIDMHGKNVDQIGTMYTDLMCSDRWRTRENSANLFSYNRTWNHIDLHLDLECNFKTLKNAVIQAAFSLSGTSPGNSVGADSSSLETKLLDEEFSEYDEINDNVVVNLNEGFKFVYGENIKNKEENFKIKYKNSQLLKELAKKDNEIIETKKNMAALMLEVARIGAKN